MNKLETVAAALLYCMACALNGKTASAQLVADTLNGRAAADSQGADFSALLTFAQRHSVAALTASALDGAGLSATDAALWRNAANSALRRAVLFDNERREILSFLDASGIWHTPLKGAILQDFYPAYGLREMSDNDILHDPDAWRAVRDFMLARGYRQASPPDRGKEICYTRPPLYCFEMHAELFSPTSQFYAYYKDIKARLRPDPDTLCGFRFSDEDFYLYLLAHAFHHFRYAGTGFRTLADVYVWRRAKRMDADYLKRELAALGLTDFESRLDRLSRELFACPEETLSRLAGLSADDREFLRVLSASGTFGTEEQSVKNLLGELDGHTAWGYCLARLRIAAKRYRREAAPVPATLYPLYLGGCLARDAFRSRKKILRDIRTARRENHKGASGK